MQRRGQLIEARMSAWCFLTLFIVSVCSDFSADAVLISKPMQVCVWLGYHLAVHQGSVCAQMTWPRFPTKHPGATRWATHQLTTPAHPSHVAHASLSLSADQDLTADVFWAFWDCWLFGPSFVHTSVTAFFRRLDHIVLVCKLSVWFSLSECAICIRIQMHNEQWNKKSYQLPNFPQTSPKLLIKDKPKTIFLFSIP